MNTSSPKVSVIMAEYNTALGDLKQSIESILSQTFSDFEFIIIDDCGKNDIAAVARQYNDPRIRVLKNDSNRGLVYSLNVAVNASRADYLVRMDTDDIALPERIERIFNFITSHPEYSVVGSRVMEFSEEGNTGVLGVAGQNTAKSVMMGQQLVHPSVIMRKDVVVGVGGYPDYHRAEDLALWCELLAADFKLYVVDDILLKYRVNAADYSKRKLKYRMGDLRARLHYYPRIGASFLDYLRIIRMFASSVVPNKLIHVYRSKRKKGRGHGE